MTAVNKPTVLIVRDGWGHNPNPQHDAFNAIKQAHTPHNDALLAEYPNVLINTSGEEVGLPEGTMGNSEVGHQNIGAGRVVYQDSVRITREIRSGSFFENQTLVSAVEAAKSSGGYVHLLGLASDAGVHSLLGHLYACLQLCQKLGQDKVALHLFMDGRDTGPYTGKGFAETIENKCREIGVGVVATVSGRYYAMDRDNRWERVQRAYGALTGRDLETLDVKLAADAQQAIDVYYQNPTNDSQKGDEFIEPTIIADSFDAGMDSRIKDGDTVIFFNYRGDRPREITRVFVLDDDDWAQVAPSPESGAKGFARGDKINTFYVTMTAYEEGLPVNVAYPKPPKMKNIAGQYLADLGLKQFRCAETEKFPHVTFFFNDYREEPFPGEDRQMAQSPKVATYDLQPEMSAFEVCEMVLKQINEGDYDFIVVNFANGDMVGHTGKMEAAKKALEAVDQCVGKIVAATLAKGGRLLITADHGNAEQEYSPESDAAHTAHTTYPVDCIVVDPARKDAKLRENGCLADIMPTLLEMMGLDKPEEMTGVSLLQA